ncbi:MAG: sigma factor-like helix-turn-helix DNA-binding protein [Candidatus Nanoarchaeia archaeon]|nr:sigma factor-like helix-turn-helix DNA-binding protein [Candidatus Nanoarchaeia archaeon]MDD5740704.1 sigma factor-like helix-turn-helix DNA-binding protein [Candidatus Nanoarchaeia archaeon]
MISEEVVISRGKRLKMTNKNSKYEQMKFERRTNRELLECSAKNQIYFDETAEQNDMKDYLYGLLKKLEARKGIRYRIAVEQCYLQQRTFKDIGEILGISGWRASCINKKALRYLNRLIRENYLKSYLGAKK